MNRTRSLLAALLVGAVSLALVATPGSAAEPTAAQVATVDAPRAKAAQRANLLMHPPLAQPGKRPQAAGRAKSSMSAVFKPARAGRTVVLKRKRGARWVRVATRRQNQRGIAQFNAAYRLNGQPQRYRAVAKRFGDLRKVATPAALTDAWGEADFSDEFSAGPLGDSWAHRLQGYSKASRRKCSRADPRAASVRQGTLRLSVLRDKARTTKCRYQGRRYQYRLNGSVGTQGTQSFTYGYAAARIRFQPRRGQHGSFWLQPESPAAGEGSAKLTGAEIDVAEWFGNGHPHGGLTSFIHHYPDDGKAGVTAKKVGGFIKNPDQYGGRWAQRYHVFSVEWTPKRYIFRIDGKETFRTNKGVSGQQQYLILSLLSSDYELRSLGGEKRLPQHLDVDWVRYWER